MSPTIATALACHGGEPAVSLAAPRWPQIDEIAVERMAEVVRSGNWSWLGPHERAFSRDWAAFHGSRHVICMAIGG